MSIAAGMHAYGCRQCSLPSRAARYSDRVSQSSLAIKCASAGHVQSMHGGLVEAQASTRILRRAVCAAGERRSANRATWPSSIPGDTSSTEATSGAHSNANTHSAASVHTASEALESDSVGASASAVDCTAAEGAVASGPQQSTTNSAPQSCGSAHERVCRSAQDEV